MAWFDANDYFFLEAVAQERLHDMARRPSALLRLAAYLLRGVRAVDSEQALDRGSPGNGGGDLRGGSSARRPRRGDGADQVASFIREDRRRRIDGVIDYFGESPTRALRSRAS